MRPHQIHVFNHADIRAVILSLNNVIEAPIIAGTGRQTVRAASGKKTTTYKLAKEQKDHVK
jgi:hypothetical protein